jgi:formiminoglutamate deiminase
VRTYWAPYALLPGGLARDVTASVAGGRFTAVTAGTAPGGADRLPGVLLPGFANAHSHAFHRALRGRTHDAGGTFWTWRDRMYAVADRLDPDSYLALARAAYAEMALAGVTGVGEFHYLHHQPGGRPYADPNAMAEALRAAAAEAGVRLTLLDTCYLAGGLDGTGHRPLAGVQERFGDGTVAAWAERVAALRPSAGMRVGAAVHSVRAVPAAAVAAVAAAQPGPLHAHLSEQPAENEACLAYYGCTPTELLADRGALGGRSTVVHATHLTAGDVAVLGRSGTTACLCPTTERDLADGIGPARALADAGSPLAVGSDQHAVVDLLAEARAVEMHERLASRRRGRFAPAELLAALTRHQAIGWDAGRIEPGARADLVAVALDSPRTAGGAPDQVLLTATAADVRAVLVDGEVVVRDGQHRLGDVGRLLQDAIAPLWPAG